MLTFLFADIILRDFMDKGKPHALPGSSTDADANEQYSVFYFFLLLSKLEKQEKYASAESISSSKWKVIIYSVGLLLNITFILS